MQVVKTKEDRLCVFVFLFLCLCQSDGEDWTWIIVSYWEAVFEILFLFLKQKEQILQKFQWLVTDKIKVNTKNIFIS